MTTAVAAEVPSRLRAVALLFVFWGTGQPTILVLEYFLFSPLDEFRPDLTILFTWLGICLLKRSATARIWGLIFGWIAVVGGTVGLASVLIFGQSVKLRIPGRYDGPVPTWASVLWVTVWLGVGLSIVCVLNVVKRKGWFLAQLPRGTTLDPRTRRQVLSAVVAGAAFGVGVTVAGWTVPKAEDTGFTTMRDSGLWFVGYGTRFGRLSYVLFQKGNQVVSPALRMSKPGSAYLNKPDGTLVDLPGEHQLYEILDDQWRTSKGQVTLEELKAFLDSRPEQYTLDRLLRFVESLRPAKQSQ